MEAIYIQKIQPVAQGQTLKKTSTVNIAREYVDIDSTNSKREKLTEQVAPIETSRYWAQSLKKNFKYDSEKAFFFSKQRDDSEKREL